LKLAGGTCATNREPALPFTAGAISATMRGRLEESHADQEPPRSVPSIMKLPHVRPAPACNPVVPNAIAAWLGVACLLLVAGLASPASARAEAAAERTVSPATWGTAAALFDERIEVPAPNPRSLMFVRCFGAVREDGTIARVDCNPNRENRAYSERLGLAVSEAAVGLKLEPAVFDGLPVPLRRFPFSVMVAPHPEDPFGRPLTKVVANHLLETRTYGTDYTAPQAVFTDQTTKACGTNTEIAFAYTVAISARGEPGEITIADEEARAQCEGTLRRFLDDAVFIPASFGGRFVDANFLDSVDGSAAPR